MPRIQDLPQWTALVAEYERTKDIVGGGNSVTSKVGELLWVLDHPDHPDAFLPCQTKLHAGNR